MRNLNLPENWTLLLEITVGYQQVISWIGSVNYHCNVVSVNSDWLSDQECEFVACINMLSVCACAHIAAMDDYVEFSDMVMLQPTELWWYPAWPSHHELELTSAGNTTFTLVSYSLHRICDNSFLLVEWGRKFCMQLLPQWLNSRACLSHGLLWISTTNFPWKEE
jgi:hypothetical protein